MIKSFDVNGSDFDFKNDELNVKFHNDYMMEVSGKISPLQIVALCTSLLNRLDDKMISFFLVEYNLYCDKNNKINRQLFFPRTIEETIREEYDQEISSLKTTIENLKFAINKEKENA